MRRRVMMPLAVVFIVRIAEFVIALFVSSAYPGTTETLRIANGLITLAIPVAILIGQIRGDRLTALSLGQIAIRGREDH